jgi:antirestriction protein ArdC
MSHVIDISNKERLLKEIHRSVQLSIPNMSTQRAKAELQIEIIEMMLDSGLGINDTGKKCSTDYGMKLDY